MARALRLAERGRGRTNPNPMVGAVVVDHDGVIVGRGAHERAGGPHAEIIALADAGERARGATLYCTLEPCSHTGRTGPCAPRVVEAGIRRAVIAVAIAHDLKLPIRYVGVGEAIDDLIPFSPEDYVNALFEEKW